MRTRVASKRVRACNGSAATKVTASMSLHHGSRPYSLVSHGRRSSQKGEPENGLTITQVEAFREVFGLFDVNGGGTIDAQELHSTLCSVDIHLSHDEIEDVLCVMDEDGNGEVDFEEFLALMTSTEKYLEALGGVVGSDKEQKETLLFSALTKFMTKSALSSLSEIERYYDAKVRKSPHVVGHYAAGARLIGLTEKQMAKHLATLNQSGDENSNSPYAQPVSLFSSPIKLLKPRRNGKIKLRIVNKRIKEPENTEDDGQSDATKTDDSAVNKPVSGDSASTACRNKTPTSCLSSLHLRPQSSVKLPAISMKNVQKNPDQLTIEDLPTIRSQVQRAYSRFYIQQKKRDKHLVQAFADMSSIPRRLQLPFLLILTAYNVKPVNIPPRLGLRLAQQQAWQKDQLYVQGGPTPLP